MQMDPEGRPSIAIGEGEACVPTSASEGVKPGLSAQELTFSSFCTCPVVPVFELLAESQSSGSPSRARNPTPRLGSNRAALSGRGPDRRSRTANLTLSLVQEANIYLQSEGSSSHARQS
jgi:hypothetical protein